MAENTSKVQHITALDFDMNTAMLQLDELLAKFNSIANKIADKTIPISLQDAFEAKDEINRLKEEIDRLNKEIEDYNQRASEAGDSTDNFAKRADALSDIITYKLVNALEEAGRAAYEAVKSTEDSMTEISRVLELTGSEAENMRSQLFGLGQEFGRSFDDVSAAALKFAQSGSNMQESIENTRAMMLALNTAELDVESGTQSLIGIMSQWNMEASDLTTIIDKLNYTADNNAVTTQDLVDGLLKASSMAKTAGISFNDTVGVLTALKESSGAAGKEVGNAFKSILAYIQRPKSLDLFDEMGIEVYADKVTGELLPMMTILENMTNKWNTSQTEMLDTMIKSGDAAQMMSEEWAIATDTMDEYTDYQNAMAEATDKANTAEARAQAAAGVYRRNYYISLMENFTKAKLKNLTVGTEEYAKTLENLIETERSLQQDTLNEAAKSANQEMNSAWDNLQVKGNLYSSKDYANTSYDYDISQLLMNNGYAIETSNGGVNFNFTTDMLENYTRLQNAIELLREERDKLYDQGKEDEAEAYSLSKAYKHVNEAYTLCKEKVDAYVKSLVAQKENEYIIQKGIPKTYAEQVKMNDIIFMRTGLTDDYRESVNELIPLYYTATDAELDFMEALSSSNVEQTITNMAKAGTLTTTLFNEILKSNTDLSDKMRETGLTTNEVVAYLNELYKGYDKVATGAKSAGEQVEDFAKLISSTEKNISSLNSYIQTLNEGNGLTAEQVLELCDNYGLLSEQFTLTEKGYQIEVSALEQLREVQAKAAIAARTSQINQTKVLKEGVLDRIAAYGIEIDSIANLAEAQAALAELEKERAMASAGISSRSDYEEWNKKYNTDEYRGLVDSIKDIATAYEDTERLADGFYNKLGISFDKGSKGANDEKDALKELTAAFEHLVEVGVYSIDEQIAYYEDLRRTLALTEEQYKSLESTLSKLYQEQLKQQQEAIKEQYENQKQAIEDRYDDEKEALKKALDDEKDARKEYWSDELDNLKTSLNEQISTAKKVYEQKKKLTEKSHDNQQKSLEALRDSELANIKATYNAQIDALNKIKAARQAERDEEDYQNKRAELLEQISYYEQRTGTDAVEQLESLRKQLAELDRDRQRELEDDNIDNQISSLEEERDSKTEAVKNSYNQQINALKTAQEIEVDMYKETYDREVELLKKRLETETKEMEKRRDRDLKRLEEEQSAKLKALEDEKDAAIKAADIKWKEIQKVFNDSNLALIAAAGQFAPALYEQFHNLFTSRFELDLQELASLMEQLETKKSTFAAKSGVKPTTKAPDTSLQLTIPSFINSKNMAAAATGGKTLSDGIAMLHKDELVVNAPVTKMLEDILTKISPITKLDAMAIQGNIARYWGEKSIQGYRERTTNIRNSYQNSTNNDSSTSVINNFNAPLQHIERVEDNVDMEAAANALERDIMRKISTML